MLILVLWQHVVFLCVSRTLFTMSLVIVVRHMLCSVRLGKLHLYLFILRYNQIKYIFVYDCIIYIYILYFSFNTKFARASTL